MDPQAQCFNPRPGIPRHAQTGKQADPVVCFERLSSRLYGDSEGRVRDHGYALKAGEKMAFRSWTPRRRLGQNPGSLSPSQTSSLIQAEWGIVSLISWAVEKGTKAEHLANL